MFVLFRFTFGDEFFVAAVFLLSIEFIGQFFKLVDFSYLH